MSESLPNGLIVSHPLVIGELACGNLAERLLTLRRFDRLAHVTLASPRDVRDTIERRRLSGRVLGCIDVHLLASSLLSPPVTLRTRDRRLHSAALELGVAHADDPFH